jgi:hypothetical protein
MLCTKALYSTPEFVLCAGMLQACTQINSAVALASALYSDSVLERDTVAYFLALQETRLPP